MGGGDVTPPPTSQPLQPVDVSVLTPLPNPVPPSTTDPVENPDKGDCVHDEDSPANETPPRDPVYSISPLQYVGYDRRGNHCSKNFQTPNGTKFWVPEVSVDDKPYVGAIFSSWQHVMKMYQRYAELSGFVVRVGGFKRWNGAITHRTLLCNKWGKPKGKSVDTTDPATLIPSRGCPFKVTDCKALIRLKAIKGSPQYVLYEFSEKHNHDLISSDNMDLTRTGRHLDFQDIKFIHTMSLHRVGPTVAHRLHSALKGGHHNMKGTKSAYKNVSRDIRMFIGDRDMLLVLGKLEQFANNHRNFSYDIHHVGGEVKAIYWADEISQINYRSFGDVIAFDATYSTNKYNMIFVPFTGVDHHKKCVTFAAALLSDETADSYLWLLRCFLKTHKTHPSLVLTDQDPAMKVAVLAVFVKSHHRLCMWHIMKKLPSKISSDIYENSNIRSAIHKLVWSVYITPSTFEDRWSNLINSYNLLDNVWLNDMFAIRHMWVPAYFREIPMCCLMKTTSRCESSNASFKVNSSHAHTLVQFHMAYDTALDNQRYNQRTVDYVSCTTRLPQLSGLPIEKHAERFYTQTLFKEVQKEIYKGLMCCFITNVDVQDNTKVFTISHMDKRTDFVNEFYVYHHLVTKSYECSCMGFTRMGYLCRHIFCVLRLNKVTEIPDAYISPRWYRESLPTQVFSLQNRLTVYTSEQAVLRNDVLQCVNDCVDKLRDNIDGLSGLATKLKEIKEEIQANQPTENSCKSRTEVIKMIVGVEDVAEVNLTAPQGIRNKGCGTNRRLIGPGEKAIEKSMKKPRLCKICNEYTHHDSRNCHKKVKPGAPDPTV